MALTARQGLNLLGAASDTVPAAHYNPDVKARAAIGMVTAQLLGGEGIYSGGAAVVGDLTVGGTLYPAVTLIVYDDSGEAWFFRKSGTTAITFTDASGACSLYAVVQQIAALSPAGAVGGATNVLFVSQLTATAAPAHSLLLGAGNVTASAYTTFTPDAGATPGAAVMELFDLDADTGTAETVDGGETVTIAGDAATIRTAVGATNTVTVSETALTLLGPPVADSWVAGDRVRDAAGAKFVCTSTLYQTWQQEVTGTPTGALLPPEAADFNTAAIHDPYRWHEDANGIDWTWDSTLTRWVGPEFILPLGSRHDDVLTTSGTWSSVAQSQAFDLQVLSFAVAFTGAAGTWDGSHYWEIDIRGYTWDAGASVVLTDVVTVSAAGASGGRAAMATDGLYDASTYDQLAMQCTLTGVGTGDLQPSGCSCLCRLVRV